jgi:hypothetical protein
MEFDNHFWLAIIHLILPKDVALVSLSSRSQTRHEESRTADACEGKDQNKTKNETTKQRKESFAR